MLYGLDLFSGIGGNSLALRQYVKTIAYCEQDRHAQSVLLSRMSEGKLGRAPIWDDVSTLSGSHFANLPIDIIIAGFPCQDISVAGNGTGLEGKRSGLFFEIMRLAEEIKPPFIFLENVPAIRTRGLPRVIEELSERGYDSRWGMLSAFDVGAPHKRERWFLLAYSSSAGNWEKFGAVGNKKGEGESKQALSPCDSSPAISNTSREGLERQQLALRTEKTYAWTGNNSWWETEPDLDRVVNGLPLRVDRIKRIGNAVVPAQAKEAFERLMGIK